MKLPNLKNILLGTILIFSMVACGTIGTVKDTERLKNVKRVAIISFEIQQDQPKDSLGLGSIAKGGDMMKTFAEKPEIKNMAKDVYQILAESVEKSLGVKTLKYRRMVAHPQYKTVYNKKMKGIRHQTFVPNGVEVIYANGILDASNFRSLSLEGRRELARKLGVDAFIEYQAYQHIDQGFGFGNLTGEGDFKYKTRSNFRMFGLDSEEPIWQLQNVDGEQSRDSSDIKGKSQVFKQGEIGKESAILSIEALFQEKN